MLVVLYTTAHPKTLKLGETIHPEDLAIKWVDITPNHFKQIRDLLPEDGGQGSIFDCDLRMGKAKDRRISFTLLSLKARYKMEPALLAYVEKEAAKWRPQLAAQLGQTMSELRWKLLLAGKGAEEPFLDALDDLDPKPAKTADDYGIEANPSVRVPIVEPRVRISTEEPL
jgi:hypothetical protein